MNAPALRTQRLEHRIAPQALEMVRQAAQGEGRSVSDFVTAAAYEAALASVERRRSVRDEIKAQWADPKALEASYEAMAADGVREAEAEAWIEGLISDVAGDD